jgi:DNA mismatch repair protein MutH
MMIRKAEVDVRSLLDIGSAFGWMGVLRPCLRGAAAASWARIRRSCQLACGRWLSMPPDRGGEPLEWAFTSFAWPPRLVATTGVVLANCPKLQRNAIKLDV